MNTSTHISTHMAPPDSSLLPSADSLSMSGTAENSLILTDQDKMFADKAAKGGLMEVALGEYAEINASNFLVKPSVK
ncbi:MAG: hypothetical protein ACOH1X_08800 [Kaistella sp.]